MYETEEKDYQREETRNSLEVTWLTIEHCSVQEVTSDEARWILSRLVHDVTHQNNSVAILDPLGVDSTASPYLRMQALTAYVCEEFASI